MGQIVASISWPFFCLPLCLYFGFVQLRGTGEFHLVKEQVREIKC